MMANAEVELVGGPRDGDRVIADTSQPVWTVPAIELSRILTSETEPEPGSILRTAQYQRMQLRDGTVQYAYVKGSLT